MRYTGFFPSCLLPLALPSWEGLGVGSSCLLPLASCLLPKTQKFLPHRI
ncbi:hypothetical protein BJP36_40140 [Moorena producens JHB]|uniref:Uncharacterized protein n=1 Tax=Moorena producens (strain JHB) TaxID=1454205 RepID=A0A9Q9SS05_MOOP1|nr:hypothetical protein [Moorena producens]WAN68588.1 hypothetical protein BJP36_40140 [Moorena producens JHB]